MPKSRVRPKAAEKKKHANKIKLMVNKAAKEAGISNGPAPKPQHATSLTGGVKVNNLVSRPMYHSRKGSGE